MMATDDEGSSKRARTASVADRPVEYNVPRFKAGSPELFAAALDHAVDELAGAELDPKARAALIQVWREMFGKLEADAKAVRAWQAKLKKQARAALEAAELLRAAGLPEEDVAKLKHVAEAKPLPGSRALIAADAPPHLLHLDPANRHAHLAEMNPNTRRTLASLLMGHRPGDAGMTTVAGVVRAEMRQINANAPKPRKR